MSESKERLTYRPEPETRQKIEQWYEADNCRSMNEFIDKAVSFYADWLSANRNNMLPMAISSAMNGRLKILEKNLSSLSFRHAVELDMLMGIIAHTEREKCEADQRAHLSGKARAVVGRR